MFNPKEEKDKIVKFIRAYYDRYDLGGVVIGISGGKDSGVVAGLFTEALGPDRIVGVTLPCHSKATDKNDAQLGRVWKTETIDEMIDLFESNDNMKVD